MNSLVGDYNPGDDYPDSDEDEREEREVREQKKRGGKAREEGDVDGSDHENEHQKDVRIPQAADEHVKLERG